MTKFDPLKEFNLIADKYLAPIEPLISVKQVNDWCKNKTHGKIDKILNELDPNTLMILLNAVYFKGEWASKFMPFLIALPFPILTIFLYNNTFLFKIHLSNKSLYSLPEPSSIKII